MLACEALEGVAFRKQFIQAAVLQLSRLIDNVLPQLFKILLGRFLVAAIVVLLPEQTGVLLIPLFCVDVDDFLLLLCYLSLQIVDFLI